MLCKFKIFTKKIAVNKNPEVHLNACIFFYCSTLMFDMCESVVT